jgi:hypothetical protein
MTARTTEEEVQAVVEVSSDVDILLFIDAASILVDKVEDCAAERGQTLSDAQLRHIETYLAAYFYMGRDPRYKSKRTERAAATFTVPDYWEMARRLDTSGCLDSFGREQHYIEFAWAGKPPSEQIDYEDRD